MTGLGGTISQTRESDVNSGRQRVKIISILNPIHRERRQVNRDVLKL